MRDFKLHFSKAVLVSTIVAATSANFSESKRVLLEVSPSAGTRYMTASIFPTYRNPRGSLH